MPLYFSITRDYFIAINSVNQFKEINYARK